MSSITLPIAIFRLFFFKKKDFSENPVNLDMGSQLKLNFNFDDIRTNFLQILTYYSFSRRLCSDDARQN